MNRTLPILATALFLTGCPQNSTGPKAPMDLTRITPEAPAAVYYSGLGQAQRTAVFDEPTFAAIWAHAFANRQPAPPLPSVDFAREFVIVAALGERASGGYAISVARAGHEGDEVTAEIVTTSPGKNCMVTLAMTQPLDIVKLALPAKGAVPVRFVEKAVVENCGP